MIEGSGRVSGGRGKQLCLLVLGGVLSRGYRAFWMVEIVMVVLGGIVMIEIAGCIDYWYMFNGGFKEERSTS